MKARDLRGKNIEDINQDSDNPKEGEEDQVAAAYENISKKLNSLRNSGKDDEVDDSGEGENKADKDEEELEEWKGPARPSGGGSRSEIDIEEEEEHELRRVKLKNLDDSKSQDDDEDEIEELEAEEEAEDRSSKTEKDDEDLEPLPGTDKEEGEKEAWKPEKNDPLDDEDSEEEESEAKESDSFEEEKKEEAPKTEDAEENDNFEEEVKRPIRADESEESERFESRARFEEDKSEQRTVAQPDSLDDLTEDNQGPSRDRDDSDDYYIPNLKGSRQEAEMGYNTASERGGIGQSYSPKSSYMDGNDPNNFFSQHQQPQAPKRANKFHLLILVLIGIAVIGFTVYILKGGFGEISLTSQPSPSPAPTATPEPTPTPTPEPEVNRGDFTIRVLNGTSTTGLAKTVNDKLEELGYDTANPGNATNSAFTQTIVRVKEGTQSSELLQRLILDLAPDYEAQEGPNLSNSSSNDAEVILGTD